MVDEQVAVEHGTVSHTISREEDGVVHERRVLASGERVEVFYKAPAPRPREGRASTFHDFTVPAAAAVPGPEPEPEPHPPMPGIKLGKKSGLKPKASRARNAK